jgi:hypothetical protein
MGQVPIQKPSSMEKKGLKPQNRGNFRGVFVDSAYCDISGGGI